VEASRQVAVRQVATVAPHRAVEEVARLVVLAPGKGKQACIILNVDEVSSDEDEPLQKRMWWVFGAGPSSTATAVTMATANKETADRRTAEEAVVKRAMEEAAVKAVADEEVIGKTVDEAAGAAGDSPAPS
jgi:hypothetical protein